VSWVSCRRRRGDSDRAVSTIRYCLAREGRRRAGKGRMQSGFWTRGKGEDDVEEEKTPRRAQYQCEVATGAVEQSVLVLESTGVVVVAGYSS
jgi:hypothetical protein